MKNMRTIASGIGIAVALGAAGLGIGVGTANAAPPSPAAQADFAQLPEWGGPGRGPWGGPGGPGRWYPPPPPAYGYGYGGYDPGPPCISGPLGFLQFCP
jgi:hypothetical protein